MVEYMFEMHGPQVKGQYLSWLLCDASWKLFILAINGKFYFAHGGQRM